MHKPEQLQERVALAPYTTMKVGGPADYFMTARTREDVRTACLKATEQKIPVFVLGEGSNIVVSDEPVHRVVLKIEIPGLEIIEEDATAAVVRVGAGEHWDGVVKQMVEQGLAGIEAMSMIPGTTGAAPVQNAGAYGQEIADTLVEVEAYDTESDTFVVLSHGECGFGYRMSRFKTDLAGRYVIVGVTLKLSKGAPAAPTYESLKRYMSEHEIAHPTLAQIREAVMAIRARILPDPSVVPNSGSFFKNPIVTAEELARLKKQFPDMPSYSYGDQYKLAAGWIMEQCGFKGSEHFGLKLWANHAMVITNPSGAGYDDLRKLVDLMVKSAHDKFGVKVEPEPLFIT